MANHTMTPVVQRSFNFELACHCGWHTKNHLMERDAWAEAHQHQKEMAMKLKREDYLVIRKNLDTGEEEQVVDGDMVTSFRGWNARFSMVSRAPGGNSEGKVIVEKLENSKASFGGEYYPSVFGLELRAPVHAMEPELNTFEGPDALRLLQEHVWNEGYQAAVHLLSTGERLTNPYST